MIKDVFGVDVSIVLKRLQPLNGLLGVRINRVGPSDHFKGVDFVLFVNYDRGEKSLIFL